MDTFRSGQPKLLLPDYDRLVSEIGVKTQLSQREGVPFEPPSQTFAPPSYSFTLPEFLENHEEKERGMDRLIRNMQTSAYELALPAASLGPKGYEPPFVLIPVLAMTAIAMYVRMRKSFQR